MLKGSGRFRDGITGTTGGSLTVINRPSFQGILTLDDGCFGICAICPASFPFLSGSDRRVRLESDALASLELDVVFLRGAELGLGSKDLHLNGPGRPEDESVFKEQEFEYVTGAKLCEALRSPKYVLLGSGERERNRV